MKTVLLLTIANVFMTFAWYWHISGKFLTWSLPVVVVASWSLAFFEYCFQVPANRLGTLQGFNPGQLKILQEAITLTVFTIFARTYLGEKLTWNYFAGIACVFVGVVLVYYKQIAAAV
jgi:uncharacterized protein (DUF486 family)